MKLKAKYMKPSVEVVPFKEPLMEGEIILPGSNVTYETWGKEFNGDKEDLGKYFFFNDPWK